MNNQKNLNTHDINSLVSKTLAGFLDESISPRDTNTILRHASVLVTNARAKLAHDVYIGVTPDVPFLNPTEGKRNLSKVKNLGSLPAAGKKKK